MFALKLKAKLEEGSHKLCDWSIQNGFFIEDMEKDFV